MITTPLLERKYQVQKQLDEEAQHDLQVYFERTCQIVNDVESKYGIKFRYGHPAGEALEPVVKSA